METHPIHLRGSWIWIIHGLVPRLSPSSLFYMQDFLQHEIYVQMLVLEGESQLGGFDHVQTLMTHLMSTVHVSTYANQKEQERIRDQRALRLSWMLHSRLITGQDSQPVFWQLVLLKISQQSWLDHGSQLTFTLYDMPIIITLPNTLTYHIMGNFGEMALIWYWQNYLAIWMLNLIIGAYVLSLINLAIFF